ncbi:protein LYK5-like [Salvia hispanica]|uniref:protein LYK5-like n=1 Tax=Salvia hispanica TaxID=49212 RepID=UPI002009C095|nr:protein LYK5-like [Salvia hispanica]XP_047954460.1 protein LYK5-like [Salvia hispanica]
MAMAMAFLGDVVVVLVVALAVAAEAQQSYVNNKQLRCEQSPNTTLGFVCNAAPSCTAYLTFRSTPVYNTPVTIAYLLSANASQIAAANNISDITPLPTDTLLIVPIPCSCSSIYYQHNASYTLKSLGETYLSVANNTYQSLSTCQALMAQNPYDLLHLLPEMTLAVPLRCACPTPSQTAAGFTSLLTYLLRQGEDATSVAAKFAAAGADVPAIMDANMLNQTSTIFYFTPLLVPLKTDPTLQNTNTNTTPAPSPPQPLPTTSPASSHKWIFIGVGIGAALLVILSVIALVWLFRRRSSHKSSSPLPTKEEVPRPPLSELSQGIRSAMETLSLYKLEELEIATNSFSESNRIAGSSVYRGWFNGDEAVVKVIKEDVSGEINTLRQINHSRIIRLSGFCLHQGTTYLVYEYAHNGSLKDWLHKPHLNWKQRIQIAYDVADALNYLHNFTNPPYIHKNLNTSNILLDSNMRAKLANFGLARALEFDKVTTRHVVGAQGYMAPEYIETGLLTPKLDVFAFGVIMLELLSGKEAAADKLHESIDGVLSGDNVRDKLQGFMDPDLDYPLELAYSMAQLARKCVGHNVDVRPPISEVLLALSDLLSSSTDWEDTSFTFTD